MTFDLLHAHDPAEPAAPEHAPAPGRSSTRHLPARGGGGAALLGLAAHDDDSHEVGDGEQDLDDASADPFGLHLDGEDAAEGPLGELGVDDGEALDSDGEHPSTEGALADDDDECGDGDKDDRATIDRSRQFDAHLREAAKRFGVREDHLRAIMAQESRARSGLQAGGKQSASGLMQVTGETWRDMQKAHKDLAPYDFASYWNNPRINILFGAATLASKQRKLVASGASRDGAHFAELTVAAYNGGEGIVMAAINNAKAAGSKDPGGDALQQRFLEPAIAKFPKVFSYYLTGKGKKRNRSGSAAEAIHLKFLEISKYPIGVARYLEVIKAKGLATGDIQSSTTTTETPTTTTPTTETPTTETPIQPAIPGGLTASVGRGGANNADEVGRVQQRLAEIGVSPGAVDRKVGPRTIGAIESAQRALGMKQADGLVEPGKRTERGLFGTEGALLGVVEVKADDEASTTSADTSTRERVVPTKPIKGTPLPVKAGVTMTSYLTQMSAVIQPYVPRGTRVSSGVRSTEKQRQILRGLWAKHRGPASITDEVAQCRWLSARGVKVAPPGRSNHEKGRAIDLSGAALGAIDAAVHRAKAEHPDAGIVKTLIETKQNCVHVDLAGGS